MKNYENAVTDLLNIFEKQEFPKQVAISVIAKKNNSSIPFDTYSLMNKLIAIFIGGTRDCRGYVAWKKVGRYVIQGAKSFKIIAPLISKIKNEDTGEEITKINGFKAVSVFAVEDTDGMPIEQLPYKPIKLPPLIDLAPSLGVSEIRWNKNNDMILGCYNSTTHTIELASEDPIVFLHELGHHLHNLQEDITQVPLEKAEIIAELTGAVLCSMLNITGYEMSSYKYIKEYARKHTEKEILKEISSMLNIVEKSVTFVVEKSTTN